LHLRAAPPQVSGDRTRRSYVFNRATLCVCRTGAHSASESCPAGPPAQGPLRHTGLTSPAQLAGAAALAIACSTPNCTSLLPGATIVFLASPCRWCPGVAAVCCQPSGPRDLATAGRRAAVFLMLAPQLSALAPRHWLPAASAPAHHTPLAPPRCAACFSGDWSGAAAQSILFFSSKSESEGDKPKNHDLSINFQKKVAPSLADDLGHLLGHFPAVGRGVLDPKFTLLTLTW
jgi:hypothetical protein